MLATESPFPQYFDLDGTPLNNGSLFFGVANQNPETNPITVYWDAAGAQPASQPIPTINGYAVRNGTPAMLFAASDYSITVRDMRGQMVYTAASANTFSNSNSILADLANSSNSTKGSSLIGFLQAGTGAVGRTVQSKLRDSVSVKDFGAVGDGIADDTTAVSAAIAASTSVYFPAGVYLISGGISLPDRNTSLFGDGVGISEIRFNAVSSGFAGTFTSSIRLFTARDLIITTTQSGVGTGLSLTWPEDFEFGFTSRFLLERVTFRGATDYTNGWQKCVVLNQCDNASFVSCCFKGQGGNPSNFTQAANTVSAVGVELKGRFSPTDFHFTNCWFYCLETGLSIGDTVEGVILTSCTMVEVKSGVSWTTGFWSLSYPTTPGGNASGRPQLVLLGCHISCFQHAVKTDGVVSIHISDLLAYHNVRGTQVGNLIQVVNSTECYIHDSEFWSFNTAFKTNGIVFGSNVTKSKVTDCTFVSDTAGNILVGVILQAGANDNILQGIYFRGTLGTSLISDSGARNAIGRRGVVAYNAANVSIPNSVATQMPWSNTLFDTDSFWGGSGGILTIPNGVYRVRVTASVIFDSNATGIRQLNIYKNGVISYVGQASQSSEAVSGGIATQMNVSTGVITVAPGDTFQMVLLQSSGGALNAQANVTSLAIEICD